MPKKNKMFLFALIWLLHLLLFLQLLSCRPCIDTSISASIHFLHIGPFRLSIYLQSIGLYSFRIGKPLSKPFEYNISFVSHCNFLSFIFRSSNLYNIFLSIFWKYFATSIFFQFIRIFYTILYWYSYFTYTWLYTCYI